MVGGEVQEPGANHRKRGDRKQNKRTEKVKKIGPDKNQISCGRTGFHYCCSPGNGPSERVHLGAEGSETPTNSGEVVP